MATLGFSVIHSFTGDAGQEGELIQRWVMQKAEIKCPVRRLWISSLTDESIREGFKSLKPEQDYDRLYHAGLSRAIGDWILKDWMSLSVSSAVHPHFLLHST